MISMDYQHVDNLAADQVMENDLIEIDDEIVQIIAIQSTKTGYIFTYENEFGEKDSNEFSDNEIFKLFI